MREIRFRGQRVDNGEWVYGYFAKDPKGECRIYWQPFPDATSNTYHFVKEETVGQYTGMKDKNGVDVYEGDNVQWANDYPNCPKCTAHTRENLSYGFCPRCGSKIETVKNLKSGTVVFEYARWNYSSDRMVLYGISEAMLKETEVTGHIYEPINP